MRTAPRHITWRDQSLPAWRSFDHAREDRRAEPQLRALPVALRADTGDDGELRIAGKGAVTGETITFEGLFMDWDEEIAPGAFDDVLDDDVRSMHNHNVNLLMGRTTAGTLSLEIDDDDDLFYDNEVNRDDPQAVGVHARVARGDVSGSSIMFRIAEEVADYPTDKNDLERPKFTITKIAPLYEVGSVVFPAYETTTAEAASLDAYRSVEAALRGAGVPDDRLSEMARFCLANPDAAERQLRALFAELPDLRASVCACQTDPDAGSLLSERRARYAARASSMLQEA